MIAEVGLGAVVACNILLAALLLARNRKALVNQVFALLALVVVFWSTAQYASNKETSYSLEIFSNRLSFAMGLALVMTVWLFSIFFPARQKVKKYQLFIATTVLPVTTLLTALTSLVVSKVKYNPKTEVTDVSTGQFYIVYILVLLCFLVFLIINMWKVYHSRTSSNLARQQVRTVSLGIILTFFWILITTAVVPAITGNWTISKIGSAGALFLVGFAAYAIVKHKLFDIRLIVARSLGYLLTLATLIGAYVLLVSTLSTALFEGENVSSTQQTINIVATLVFGFSLLPLKKFFDKLTNKLFYRDAYDTQQLLDELNQTLVGNIELDSILKQSADLLASTIKTEFAAFIIRETEGTAQRASYSKIVELDTHAILGLSSEAKKKTHLFVADEIEEANSKIKTVLVENNISIAARLAAAGSGTSEQGFLLLGPKQSGNPYNKQDIQVIDIIANQLVIAIQNALRFEEIETFNITLQQKVDDATKKLRQTNEKLKELDETKDEFISMASHQLRTPLTSVKGYLSMVVEGDAGKLNKQQKDLLSQSFASSQRMVYLIADLLNVSRLKTGKFVIENKPTQLADVIETEMGQLKEMAQGKQQELTYDKPDKFPTLNLDETKMRQVIMNFTDNALHYTQNGGHIKVNLADKGDNIEFTVVDDGLGVPKTEQHHLFTKFYRAGNAKKARPDGTGLGLFMAKKVVVAQGGAIIFQSEEGKGSTFGFTIPKKALKVSSNTSKVTTVEEPAKSDEKVATEPEKPTEEPTKNPAEKNKK